MSSLPLSLSLHQRWRMEAREQNFSFTRPNTNVDESFREPASHLYNRKSLIYTQPRHVTLQTRRRFKMQLCDKRRYWKLRRRPSVAGFPLLRGRVYFRLNQLIEMHFALLQVIQDDTEVFRYFSAIKNTLELVIRDVSSISTSQRNVSVAAPRAPRVRIFLRFASPYDR